MLLTTVKYLLINVKFLTILYTLCCFTSFSQKINVYVGFYDLEECKSKIKKEFAVKDTCIYKNTTDTLLAYFIKGNQSGDITFYFAGTDGATVSNYCTVQKITFDCPQCSEQALINLLHSKIYGWRKIEENKYVSNYKMHVLWDVIFDKEHTCMTLLFTYIDKPTREFKEWYNTLSKPD